jgi:hypothetical protein
MLAGLMTSPSSPRLCSFILTLYLSVPQTGISIDPSVNLRILSSVSVSLLLSPFSKLFLF